MRGITDEAPRSGRAAFRTNLAEWCAAVPTVVSIMLMHRGMSFAAIALCIAMSTSCVGMAYFGARDHGLKYFMG